ncbi:MAG: biotin transporter BioY [Oscillospiraceae bacterium]|nr:biotin transporter BioY [Oscillospiraceae bacterium]
MKIRNMARCGLFAALLALCAWLSVPAFGAVFTLQTFGVFLTLMVLGGRLGTAAVAVYILLGAVGLPAFSGFRGGIGVLLGATGGYIWGFLATGAVYWVTEKLWNKPVLSCLMGLFACYGAGAAWFAGVYAPGAGLWAALLQGVIPYVLPDGLKLLLAWVTAKRLKQQLHS